MKPLVITTWLLLSISGVAQEQVNSLIRAGKYEEALDTLKSTEGENSSKFRELKEWMSRGYRDNLVRSETDVHASPQHGSGSQGHNITLVAGCPGDWFVVMTKGAYENKDESYDGPGAWPAEWIRTKWSEGYYINHVAGEKDGWVVVMSKGTAYTGQKYFGPGPFPEKGIGVNSLDGYRITAIAGLENEWVAVVSKGSPYGHQRFSLPTSFDAQKDWIKLGWDADYYITHIAGNSSPGSSNTFVTVMSLDSGLTAQSYLRQELFPDTWVNEKSNDGYDITAAAGCDYWVVVMSKGAWSSTQTYKRQNTFPSGFIKSKW